MGLRFRKSITLFPGVKMNFGLHSQSISFGGKGFRTTYSSTGRVTRSVGIPGTGLSYVTTSNNRRPVNTPSRSVRDRREQYSTRQISNSDISNDLTVSAAEISQRISRIYNQADQPINWRRILAHQLSSNATEQEMYLKSHAEDILNGNIDTYYEVIQDVNPLDDLLQYGSNFECGTDDPRMLYVSFQVNSRAVMHDAENLDRTEYNQLLQDYVCGCTIRVARDMFALLPLRHIIVDAEDSGKTILSVDFGKRQFDELDFQLLDASDAVETFDHRMQFSKEQGFAAVHSLAGNE